MVWNSCQRSYQRVKSMAVVITNWKTLFASITIILASRGYSFGRNESTTPLSSFSLRFHLFSEQLAFTEYSFCLLIVSNVSWCAPSFLISSKYAGIPSISFVLASMSFPRLAPASFSPTVAGAPISSSFLSLATGDVKTVTNSSGWITSCHLIS